MKIIKVFLLNKDIDVQYGLNWGLRENRDHNQSYLQLEPSVYNSDFFPVKGKYFIVKTDDKETLIFNRAQKDKGCALQTPESNAIIGLYIRSRLGLPSGAKVTKDDITAYGKLDIDFVKEDDMNYRMSFSKNWKSQDIKYLFEQYLIIEKNLDISNVINDLVYKVSQIDDRIFDYNYSKNLKASQDSNNTLNDFVIFLQSDFFKNHYGIDAFLNEKQNNKVNMLFKYNSLQQIFYGAPGTGKSHATSEVTNNYPGTIRTTFHPDSDYSTFVGAYKPTMEMLGIYNEAGEPVTMNGAKLKKEQITYKFVKQAFLKAYIRAWKLYQQTATSGQEVAPQFLVIEEINRGNCAQIFGDLFQLLDRKNGFSEYPIEADEDIRKCLLQQDTDEDPNFGKDGLSLTEEQKAYIDSLFDPTAGTKRNVAEKICRGELLVLPPNLHIWATMNTSDQSLFPIDSAFKRRWDWTYVPISNAKKSYVIKVADARYDWWQFLEKINQKIGETTNSEDKKLGYFFCKADENGEISADKFVGKVIFYLWNGVFKDYEFGDAIFNDGEDGTKLTFDKFYEPADGKSAVAESKVQQFLKNLGLEPISTDEEPA